jgi:hypothetical protein
MAWIDLLGTIDATLPCEGVKSPLQAATFNPRCER